MPTWFGAEHQLVRKSRHSARVVLTAMASLVIGLSVLPAWAQTEEQYKDWTYRCDPAEGDLPERCFIVQTVKDPESGQDLAQMAIGFVPDQPDPVAIISLPLGIYLPPGVGLKVDENEPIRVPVEICDRGGCRTGITLKDPLRSSMKKGVTARILVQDGSRQPAGLPISLSGFTAALAALER
jgi:invasion protein IalB